MGGPWRPKTPKKVLKNCKVKSFFLRVPLLDFQKMFYISADADIYINAVFASWFT